MATSMGQSCWVLVTQALPCWCNYVQVVLIFLPVMPRATTSGWSRRRTVGPVLGGDVGIDRSWGWHLRARCFPCITECVASAFMFTSPLQKSVSKFNYFLIFWYSEQLVYGLYMCTREFSLRRESFNMILYNNPSFYDGDVTMIRHWLYRMQLLEEFSGEGLMLTH
jgi:hypothetical protein